MKKFILFICVLLIFLSCYDSYSVKKTDLRATSFNPTINLDKKYYEPGTTMKVYVTGLDVTKEYKLDRFNLDTKESTGMPRYIKNKASDIKNFRVPKEEGRYRIKLYDTDTNIGIATKNFFSGTNDDSDDGPSDPPVDPPTYTHNFTFEIFTDKYASDNSWILFNDEGQTFGKGPNNTYENNKKYSITISIPNGNYHLEIYDSAGDGIINPGYVKIYLNNEELYKGSRRFDDLNNPYKLTMMGKMATIKFIAGPQTQIMDEREKEYLYEHNKHRKIAHTEAGLKYIPLRWSFNIEKESQRWADYLVRNGTCNLIHENPSPMGENLAARTGNATPRPIDAVVQSWVNSPGHYSQLRWRASQYIGCAEAYGDKCSVQVCRFVTAGNCNGYDNWIEDYTPCSSICPPEGCFPSNNDN